MEIIDYTEGMKITAPMIVRGMPNEVYHSMEGVSSSYLKEVWARSIYSANKKRLDMRKKKHFELGGIFHDLTEGFTAGYDVMDRYFLYPEYKKSAKQPVIDAIKTVLARCEGFSMDDLAEIEIKLKGEKMDFLKVKAETLLEKHANGKTKITDEDLGNAEAMLEALKDHPDSAYWMGIEGESELSFFWEENVSVHGIEFVKVLMKIRCDRFIETEDSIFIPDWKSIAFVPTPKEIVKAQFNFGYDFSAAMYIHVVSKFTDKAVFFLNVFVSSVDPCKENVSVVMFTDNDLEIASDNFNSGLMKYADWQKNGGWSGVERDDQRYIQVPMRQFYGD